MIWVKNATFVEGIDGLKLMCGSAAVWRWLKELIWA
jgi:hypothetical protein